MRSHFPWGGLALAALLACTSTTGSAPPPTDAAQLAARLDALRERHGIPGMAAAITCDGAVRWSAGFGMADVARGTPATPETVFHVASITKTFASVILLQLAAEGSVSLDDPVSAYGIQLPGDVRVRHLLSHTSDPPPGARFRYDGDRYALLDSVVRRADGRPFGEAVVQRVIVPAGLLRTAPSSLAGTQARAALAQGYDGSGRTVVYPTNVGTAAGLISTVLDLLTYATAIDTGRLYPPGGRELAFTPARTPAGSKLPYGLGWFVDERPSGTVLWHFGSWIGNSSLLILAPDQGAAFAILANNDQLSTPFPLASGALDSSSFAQAFLGWLEQGEGCGP
jgi:CubicO group peptidase (beta-lactamase class C family)